jgi:dipeptidyl aminopeptidase/acylaminoacyl peptidase
MRGVRNIWIAGPPDYKARQLTAYAADDGQDLGNLAFTPDARMLVFVRGSSENRQGEVPNPTSDPAGTEQALWCVTVDSGKVRKIGTGDSPAISPRGSHVAFIKRGQVYWARLDSTTEPVHLIHARGEAGSLRWSPDGSRLAFVSGRSDHAFVGVYDVASTSLHYMDPSVDRDSNPVWSADGSQIAFIRTPSAVEPRLFRPQRSALPWSIMVASVSDGKARRIWQADTGRGSAFHGITADNQLFWTADNRIVFPWERTGWTLLYSVPAAGGKALLLTPGEFEVEHVAISVDRKTLFFDSNQGDIDRRHLWRLDPNSARPVQITKGTGIEWSPTPLQGGRAIALLRSDARTPARPAIMESSGVVRDLAAVPADFPARDLVEPQAVDINAADGMTIPAQLFVPRNQHKGERKPAVIFFHGGSRRQMLLGWHYIGYYNNAYALNQYLTSRGFIVLSVNYRSGTGYGLDFREALNYGAGGASEFNDVLGAGLYLRGRADVDPARIGLWGGSYGGFLTAMGLAKASELFAAGVDLHGVHEWNLGIQTFLPTYDPRRYEEAARIAHLSSPMAYVDWWRSPVLVIHGDDDRNVAFGQTVALVEQLRRQKVEVEQLVFPDEVHGFLLHQHWSQALHAAAEFFERRLGR